MTGPERQVNQLPPLTTEAKDKIGSFYLSNLLRNINTRKDFVFFFDGINDDIFDKTGTRIPVDLADKFDLKSLVWIIHYGKDSLPILALSRDTTKEWTNDSINDAVVTIEIARKTDHGSGHEKIIPFYLRIAGVDKEQNKIIAAKYDLTENNRLIELNISMPHNDKYNHQNSQDRSPIGSSRLVVGIPSMKDKPYNTAALITHKMCETVGFNPLKDPMFPTFPEALIFSSHPKGFFHGKNLHYVDLKKLSEYTSTLGYYTKQENGIITVGLEAATIERQRIKPWKISVPEFLQKA